MNPVAVDPEEALVQLTTASLFPAVTEVMVGLFGAAADATPWVAASTATVAAPAVPRATAAAASERRTLRVRPLGPSARVAAVLGELIESPLIVWRPPGRSPRAARGGPGVLNRTFTQSSMKGGPSPRF